jgi:hypothetical protein
MVIKAGRDGPCAIFRLAVAGDAIMRGIGDIFLRSWR